MEELELQFHQNTNGRTSRDSVRSDGSDLSSGATSSLNDFEFKELLSPRKLRFRTWPWVYSLWETLISYTTFTVPALLACLPRFLRIGGLRPTKELHPTSYLDALRGIAALIVLNLHHFPLRHVWLIQQPFFRIFISGRGMVDVFFVISGYVLSYRMLKLMREHQATPLLNSLASACFRRYLRLYSSAITASFASMILVRLRWSNGSPRTDTFSAQLADWALDSAHFCNPFVDLTGIWYRGIHSSKYLDPLYTIPVEFRGSLVLFFFCAASCKLSTRGRMLYCCFLIFLCYWWAFVYPALFLGGLFIADLSLSRYPNRHGPRSSPHNIIPQSDADTDTVEPSPRVSWPSKIAYTIVFLLALFLLGQPSSGHAKSPWPWPFLSHFLPPSFRTGPVWEHFYTSIGALLLVFAIDSFRFLQLPLRTNFCQYLGYCSFGIYVMHKLLIWLFWRLVLDPIRIRWLGDWGKWGYVPALAINYVAVIWAADYFARVDGQYVRFGRWLEKSVFEW